MARYASKRKNPQIPMIPRTTGTKTRASFHGYFTPTEDRPMTVSVVLMIMMQFPLFEIRGVLDDRTKHAHPVHPR